MQIREQFIELGGGRKGSESKGPQTGAIELGLEEQVENLKAGDRRKGVPGQRLIIMRAYGLFRKQQESSVARLSKGSREKQS